MNVTQMTVLRMVKVSFSKHTNHLEWIPFSISLFILVSGEAIWIQFEMATLQA